MDSQVSFTPRIKPACIASPRADRVVPSRVLYAITYTHVAFMGVMFEFEKEFMMVSSWCLLFANGEHPPSEAWVVINILQYSG